MSCMLYMISQINITMIQLSTSSCIIVHAIGKEVAVESTDFAAQLATCIRENSVYR